MTSNEPVIYEKSKLKGCWPNDNPTQGSVLIEQTSSSPKNGSIYRNYLKKDSQVKNEITQSIEK